MRWLGADASILVLKCYSIFNSPQSMVKLLDEFYESLDDEDWPLRGQVRISQCGIELGLQDGRRAQDLLSEAVRIYAETGYCGETSRIDLLHLQLGFENDDQAKIHSLLSLSDTSFSTGMISNSFEILLDIMRSVEVRYEPWHLVEIVETKFMPQVCASQDQLTGERFRLRQCGLSLYMSMTPMIWEAQRILSTYLEKYPDALTPAFQAIAFDHLATCYSEFEDFKMSRFFLEKAFSSEFAQHDPESRSAYREGLAELSIMHVQKSLQKPKSGYSGDIERSECLESLRAELHDLQKWVSEDSAQGRSDMAQNKMKLVQRISKIIREQCPSEAVRPITGNSVGISINQLNEEENSTVVASSSPEKFEGFRDLTRLVNDRQPLEAIRLSSRWLQDLEQDRKTSKSDLAFAYHVCACAQMFASTTTILTKDERNLHITAGLDLYSKCHQIIYEIGYSSLLVGTAFGFLNLLQCDIEAHPTQRELRLKQAFSYIHAVNVEIGRFRIASFNSVGVGVMLADRKLSSNSSIRTFYSTAIWFFLRQNRPSDAWIEIQQGRGTAFFNTIIRNSPHEKLRKIVDESLEFRPLRLKQIALHQKVTMASLDDQESEMKAYKLFVDNMRRLNPVFAEMEDIEQEARPAFISEIKELASIVNWLPAGRTAFHIEWYFMPQKPSRIVIFMTNIRNRNLDISYIKLQLSEINDWKEKYLVFPADRTKPLAVRKGALKLLKKLVTGLAEVVQKDDLLILTPPEELSLIPLHGIPVNGVPMIERHLVVYSSSLGLYHGCWQRTRKTIGRSDRSLKMAIFTAAYEEESKQQKLEREKIFNTLGAISQDLGAAWPIQGPELTQQTMKSALESSPWVHYHGHAQYPRLDVLNQGLLLGDGNIPAHLKSASNLIQNMHASNKPASLNPGTDEPKSTTRSTMEKDRITALLGVENRRDSPLNERRRLDAALSSDAVIDFLLSEELQAQGTSSNTPTLSPQRDSPDSGPFLSDILQHTSILTVNDIFTLNLRRHHPFVCLIACDSGVLDVSAGDEPLGMLSALFCQGASSAVGTLWPIESAVGRTFTRSFYEALVGQIASNETNGMERRDEERDGKLEERERVLNLTAAMREGVRAVKRERDDPYAWAPFVLHGSGFYHY